MTSPLTVLPCSQSLRMAAIAQLLLFAMTTTLYSQERTDTASSKKVRVWTDATGKFKVEAELVEIDASSVKLKKNDAKVITIPFDRLCEADRKYLQDNLAHQLNEKTITVALTPTHEVPKGFGFSPKSIDLSETKPTAMKAAPSNLSSSALYGEIPLGDADDKILVVLDSPSGSKARLIIDQNNDKDLTNDKDSELSNDRPDYWQSKVTMNVRYKTSTEPYSLNVYQWSQRTPRSLVYYWNTVRNGKLQLGFKSYDVRIIDHTSTGIFTNANLSIDFQGQGILTPVTPEEFIFGDLAGELLEIAADGSSLTIRCHDISKEPRLKIELKPVHGIHDIVKYYQPKPLQLSKERPFALKAEPKYYSASPLYGSITLGDANTQVCVVVDEPTDEYWRIFVDANCDKDLTNDGDGAWSIDGGSYLSRQNCVIEVPYSNSKQTYSLNLSRSTNNAQDKMSYFRDTMRVGKVRISGKDYRIAVLDDNGDGRFDDLSNCRLILDLRGSREDLEPLTISSGEQTNSALELLRLGSSTAQVHSISADGSQLILRSPGKKLEFDGRLALLGEKIPELSLKKLSGEQFIISPDPARYDYTLLHVWYDGAECFERLPEISRIAKRYRNSRVRMLGIYLGEDLKLAQQLTQSWDLDFVQLWDDRGLQSPLKNVMYSSYGISAPRVIVLNESNLVVEANANNPWSLEQRLITLLGAGDSSVSIPEPPTPVPMEIPSRPMVFAIPEDMKELTHLSLWGNKNVGDKDLQKLSNAGQLTWIELYGTSITDDGLKHLSGLKQLESLFLGETGISDEGLKQLAALENLKCLNIQKNPKITDSGLESLRGMKNLEVLNIYGTRVTDDGVKQLNGLAKLKHLNVTATLVGPKGQEFIVTAIPDCSLTEYPAEWYPSFGQQQFPTSNRPGKIIVRVPGAVEKVEKLTAALNESQVKFEQKHQSGKTTIELDDKYLSNLTSWSEIEEMEYRSATQKGLEAVKDMKGLKSLDLLNSRVGDAGVAHLKGMTQLSNLNLWGTKITDVSLNRLGELNQLEILNLLDTKITDRGAEVLLSFPLLQELNLSRTLITDKSLETIAKLDKLSNLELNNTKVTDQGLPALASMQQLKRLSLEAALIEGPGLAALAGLKQLEELRLLRTKIEDSSVRELANFPALKRLNLSYTTISSKGILDLKPLTSLEELFIGSTEIDDEAIQGLMEKKSLRSLGISDTKITDKGFQLLAGLPSLRTVYITEKAISQEAIDSLKKSLPKINIQQSPPSMQSKRKVLLQSASKQ